MKAVQQLIEFFLEREQLDEELVLGLIEKGLYCHAAYDEHRQRRRALAKKEEEVAHKPHRNGTIRISGRRTLVEPKNFPDGDREFSVQSTSLVKRANRKRWIQPGRLSPEELVSSVGLAFGGSKKSLRALRIFMGKRAGRDDWRAWIHFASGMRPDQLAPVLRSALQTSRISTRQIWEAIAYRNHLEAVPETARGPVAAAWRTLMNAPDYEHRGKFIKYFQEPCMQLARELALVQRRLVRALFDLQSEGLPVAPGLNEHLNADLCWAFFFMGSQPLREPTTAEEKLHFACFRSNWQLNQGVCWVAVSGDDGPAAIQVDEAVAARAFRLVFRMAPGALSAYTERFRDRRVPMDATLRDSDIKHILSFTYLWIPRNCLLSRGSNGSESR